MKVTYPQHGVVINGSFINRSLVQSPPQIRYTFEKQKMYTLVLVDPDAVGGLKIHWLIVNIQSTEQTEVIPYLGPHPPKGSGLHRYVFMLVEQTRMLSSKFLLFRSRYMPLEDLFQKLYLSCVVSEIYFISAFA